MIIGVPKEIKEQEYRVALLPPAAYQLIKRGHHVVVERGAGAGSGYPDGDYEQAGAKPVDDHAAVFGQASFTANLCNRSVSFGPASADTLCGPAGTALDTNGNLYIADGLSGGFFNSRVLEYDDHRRLTRFREKPALDFDVSMGIYCLDRSVIEALPRGVAYGFDKLMLDSLGAGHEVSIRPFEGYWLDIGRPDDYEYANEHFAELSARLGLR